MLLIKGEKLADYDLSAGGRNIAPRKRHRFDV